MFEGREYLLSPARYLKLDIPVPHEAMLAEAVALRKSFIEYRDGDAVGWHSLPIIGKSSTEPYAWNAYYLSPREAAPYMTYTEISKQCPVTVDWLKTVYPSNSYARVRFMLLEAGGAIGFHKDTEHSILGAVNIALNNPKKCAWHWRDESTLEFNPGDAYAMNISYEHSITNPSNEDRYHMIVHHYDSTPSWKQMMQTAMEKYETQGDFHYSTELF
jgi:hypothetical protein